LVPVRLICDLMFATFTFSLIVDVLIAALKR